jgi:hypothetical protein
MVEKMKMVEARCGLMNINVKVVQILGQETGNKPEGQESCNRQIVTAM